MQMELLRLIFLGIVVTSIYNVKAILELKKADEAKN